MRPAQPLPPDLQQLLEEAAEHEMTSDDRERQVVSFAYGNLRMEDERVTREMIEDAARGTAPLPPPSSTLR